MTGTVTFIRFLIEFTENGGVTKPALIRHNKADVLIDRDLSGNPHIPGASLAGALRERARNTIADKSAVDALFGNVDPVTNKATASTLWIMNATPEGDEKPEVMWATAIDRTTGAARNHMLRGAEQLQAGATFVCRLWAFDEPTLLATMKAILDGWQPQLGRGTSTGHGTAEIRDLTWGQLDLTQPSELERWLTDQGPELVDAVATTTAPLTPFEPRRDSELHLNFTVKGPIALGGEKGKPVIVHGSSIKGVIRSRIEYILRSADHPVAPCLDQRCGVCDPCRWFGHAGGRSHDPTRPASLQSAVRFQDASVDGAKGRPRTRVALDRFTGGAAIQTRTDAAIHPSKKRGGMLVTDWVIEVGTFTTKLTIKPGFDAAERARLVGLLRQVAQDFNDRLIGVGAHTTRGYGDVDLTIVEPTAATGDPE